MTPLYSHDVAVELDEMLVVDQETGEVIVDATAIEIRDRITRELAADIDNKLDRWCEAVRSFEASADSCEEEEKRFSVRKRIYRNKAKRAKEWIAFAMASTGRTKVGTKLNTASIVNNSQAAFEITPGFEIEEIAKEYPDLVRTRHELDTTAIRKAIEVGESFPFARLLPKGNHLRLT
jgi:hypothetical protein